MPNEPDTVAAIFRPARNCRDRILPEHIDRPLADCSSHRPTSQAPDKLPSPVSAIRNARLAGTTHNTLRRLPMAGTVRGGSVRNSHAFAPYTESTDGGSRSDSVAGTPKTTKPAKIRTNSSVTLPVTKGWCRFFRAQPSLQVLRRWRLPAKGARVPLRTVGVRNRTVHAVHHCDAGRGRLR